MDTAGPIVEELTLPFESHAALSRQRARLLRHLEGLPESVIVGQHWPILGPILWDLNHIACFEELWACRNGEGADEGEGLPALFDAFVHERSVRGSLDLPSLTQSLEELARVREHTLERLASPERAPLTESGFVFRMVAQHEAWHLETLLASIGLSGTSRPRDASKPAVSIVEDVVRFPVAEGWIGTEDRTTAYDNERGRHRVHLSAYALDRFPVTNQRYQAFVDAGGYADPAWWSAEGWAWRQAGSVTGPHFWTASGIQRFGRVVEPVATEPVQHVSFYEAEAFARWCGGRLPTEAEWEAAATWGGPCTGAPDFESNSLGPAPVGVFGGDGASGCRNLLGSVWEWTSSRFEAYPGFEFFPYREYSAPFFGGDYRVLRGGCWASGACVVRPTLRSWDHPFRRETLFCGFRVAYDG